MLGVGRDFGVDFPGIGERPGKNVRVEMGWNENRVASVLVVKRRGFHGWSG